MLGLGFGLGLGLRLGLVLGLGLGLGKPPKHQQPPRPETFGSIELPKCNLPCLTSNVGNTRISYVGDIGPYI